MSTDKDHDSTTLKGRLLLVEDNKSNQVLMEFFLDAMGLDVTTAEDGLKAYEAFKSDPYDAVLMDEHMPVMNGIESTRMIRRYEDDNNLKATPIIAVTGDVLEGDREKFFASGMNDYIAKPVNVAELEAVLSKYLR